LTRPFRPDRVGIFQQGCSRSHRCGREQAATISRSPNWHRAAIGLRRALIVVALICAQAALAQSRRTVNLDRSEPLFTVLAALSAAGHGTELSTETFPPLRQRLSEEFARLQGPAVEAVRQYYRSHRLADPDATLSRYISLALTLGPAPEFEFQMRPGDLPPDVQPIEEFRALLPAFYREARLGELWEQLAGDYEREIARLQEPFGQSVVVTTSYVREILNPAQPRRFTVYVEPLVGNHVHLRNYGDDYFLVVGSQARLPLEQIRHAFLHFLVDPLTLRYQSALEVAEPFLQFAAKAPGLPADYRQDIGRLVAECLVRAIELRMDRPPESQLAAALAQAEQSGYVLVRAFHRALVSYEQSEPALSQYFPELLRSLDVAAELRRLQQLEFRAVTAPSLHGGSAATAPSELEQWLTAGQRELAARNLTGARQFFERVLALRPGHPEALYGMAVVASLEGRAQQARELFQQLVALPAEPATEEVRPETWASVRAWAYIYLGRIYDMEGNRELAVQAYRAALEVPGAPPDSRSAADRGLQAPFQPRARAPEP
jgi:tetratricopeptide (TPR) repeat protein